MKIRKIYDNEKVIGKEIECACGCKKILKYFNDRTDKKLEFVINTSFAPKAERWKHNFLISQEDLRRLIK